MQNNKNAIDSKLILNLLDDQPSLKSNTLDWSMRLSLPTQVKNTTNTVAATATPTGPNAALTAKKKRPRQTQTLQKMMNEYNRPSVPMTSRPSPAIRGRASAPFQFDRVEQILLPEIPGKILRPE